MHLKKPLIKSFLVFKFRSFLTFKFLANCPENGSVTCVFLKTYQNFLEQFFTRTPFCEYSWSFNSSMNSFYLNTFKQLFTYWTDELIIICIFSESEIFFCSLQNRRMLNLVPKTLNLYDTLIRLMSLKWSFVSQYI